MEKKLIFVHGYTASSKVNWYPNISKELDKMVVDYSIPDFPGGRNPHSKEWLDLLSEEIRKTNKPIVLIGHSLGTRAILLYLDKFQLAVDVVILIAPPSENEKRREDGLLANFFDYDIDLPGLKNLADRFIVIHSKDDSVVPYEEGVEIAEKLDAELITFEDKDHMSEPENAEPILEVIKQVALQ